MGNSCLEEMSLEMFGADKHIPPSRELYIEPGGNVYLLPDCLNLLTKCCQILLVNRIKCAH